MHGDCSDDILAEAYSCACHDGYTGGNCDVDVDDCASNPYCGLGSCSDGFLSYVCVCDDGVTGSQCDTLVSPQGTQSTIRVFFFWKTLRILLRAYIDAVGKYERTCALEPIRMHVTPQRYTT